jgi:signal transduction histidine kinase
MRIILILLQNAVKFTFEGSILLEVTPSSDILGLNRAVMSESWLDRLYLKFSIEDTGIGIKEETKKQLFTLFSNNDYLGTNGM